MPGGGFALSWHGANYQHPPHVSPPGHLCLDLARKRLGNVLRGKPFPHNSDGWQDERSASQNAELFTNNVHAVSNTRRSLSQPLINSPRGGQRTCGVAPHGLPCFSVIAQVTEVVLRNPIELNDVGHKSRREFADRASVCLVNRERIKGDRSDERQFAQFDVRLWSKEVLKVALVKRIDLKKKPGSNGFLPPFFFFLPGPLLALELLPKPVVSMARLSPNGPKRKQT